MARTDVLDLRLQLLEPDKYPYLPKCLYGLLMILPQSSAFVSLRARLMAVHSGGYIPTQAKAYVLLDFHKAQADLTGPHSPVRLEMHGQN